MRMRNKYISSYLIGKFERYTMSNGGFRIKLIRESLKEDGTLDYSKLKNPLLRWFLSDKNDK